MKCLKCSQHCCVDLVYFNPVWLSGYLIYRQI
jgi:hypothetical protein